MARKRVMVARLPATLCTPEMRDQIVSIAEVEERSLSDVQREAMAFFLQHYDSKAIKLDSKAISCQEHVREN